MNNEKTSESNIVVETIDRICQKLKVERVDFIKMDIEGAEIQAVVGALASIRMYRPKLAIATYHRSFDFRCLKAILDSEHMKSQAAGITNFGNGEYRPVMLHAY